MPPLVTHLVIGERVFAQLPQDDPTPRNYGSFLLGCLLVDVNAFSQIDRRHTHFVGRLDEDGEDAFKKSCVHFLDQLDTLLLHPWQGLAETERAFIAGYLCHLAADEYWKEFGWNLLQVLGIPSLEELPVPGDVILTAFDVLSKKLVIDSAAMAHALQSASIPNLLTHVPHDTFQKMWNVVRAHALGGCTPESYFKMLARTGKTDTKVQEIRQQHDLHMETAMALIQRTGGIEPHIQTAVKRSLEIVPRLWQRRPSL